MTQSIVFKNSDGSCGIITPSHSALEKMKIEELAKKDVPDGKSWRIIDPKTLPENRYFRDAWTINLNTKIISVKMDKARIIHLNEIRKHRNKKLKELDVETLKGRDVQTEKQKLRDLPQNFDLTSAKTPDDLKNLWPTELLPKI